MKIEKTVKVKQITEINNHLDLLNYALTSFNIKNFYKLTDRLENIFIEIYSKYKNDSISLKRLNMQCTGIWGKTQRAKEYWLIRGYSEEEAKKKIDIGQIAAASKGRLKLEKLKNEDFSKWAETRVTRIEYWLKRGYTRDEGEEIIAENARTSTLEKFITRAGGSIELGLKRFNDAQDRKRVSWGKRSLEEQKAINESKAFKRDDYILKYGLSAYYKLLESTTGMSRASKESLRLFIPLIEKLKNAEILNMVDYYIGIDDKREWFIHNGKSICLYDFCIPELAIIVEYHGECFHPNIRKYSLEELKTWKSPFGLTLNNAIAKDKLKRELAIEKGFHIIEVYSSEDISGHVETIFNLINERYQKWNTKILQSVN